MSKIIFYQREVEDKHHVMILSSFLKSKGFDSEIIIDPHKSFQKIKDNKPDFIGINLLSSSVPWALDLCRHIKKSLPDVLIILGGTHPTCFPDIIKEDGVDMICIGEAEKPLLHLMQSYDGTLSSIKNTPNFWIKINNRIIRNETIYTVYKRYLYSICRRVAPLLNKMQDFLPFRKSCIFLDPHLFKIMGKEPYFPRHEFSDYCHQLYFDALMAKPKLIVELGTCQGISTRVLLAAAENIGATLLSIDINDCCGIAINEEYKKKWYFEQCDDVYFAQHKFEQWKSNNGIDGKVDLLFIDTSHMYDHTVQEIKAWFPKLSDHATVIFHDTNVQTFYWRHDNSFGLGWNNNRGVIRAIEEYLKSSLDEKVDFVGCIQGWAIKHDPLSAGYTIMKRI